MKRDGVLTLRPDPCAPFDVLPTHTVFGKNEWIPYILIASEGDWAVCINRWRSDRLRARVATAGGQPSIPALVRLVCRARWLSQRRLAERIFVSPGYLSKVLSGKRLLSNPVSVRLLARELGLDESYVLRLASVADRRGARQRPIPECLGRRR